MGWGTRRWIRSRREASELDAHGGEELLHFGEGGPDVLYGLDVEGDVEGVGCCCGHFAERFFNGGDEGGECSDDFGGGLQGVIRAGEPFEGVFGADFDSFFNTDKNVCHDKCSFLKAACRVDGQPVGAPTELWLRPHSSEYPGKHEGRGPENTGTRPLHFGPDLRIESLLN